MSSAAIKLAPQLQFPPRVPLCHSTALKTIFPDINKTLLVVGHDHETVCVTFQPYLSEFLTMLLEHLERTSQVPPRRRRQAGVKKAYGA